MQLIQLYKNRKMRAAFCHMVVVSFVSESTRGKLQKSLWLVNFSESIPSGKFGSDHSPSYHSHAHTHTWDVDEEPLERE